MTLTVAAFGRDGAVVDAMPVAPALGACRADGAVDAEGECLRRAEFPRGGMTEWWESTARGLERASPSPSPDCDGAVDEGLTVDAGGDGYSSLASCGGSEDDCDDGAAGIHPGVAEACGGIDQDCDGVADDGLSADADGELLLDGVVVDGGLPDSRGLSGRGVQLQSMGSATLRDCIRTANRDAALFSLVSKTAE